MNADKRTRRTDRALILLLALLPFDALAAESWQLSAADWSRPRSGLAVQQLPPLANAVRAWQAAVESGDDAHLLLVHPGGEAGSLWASELRDWLVALAVPPQAIELVPGGLPPDRLELKLQVTASTTEGNETE